MNETERTCEHRRWRLWEFIGGFLSVFHFRPWRDLTMGRKILPRLSAEPPLVTLDKLAQGELPPEIIYPISDPDAAEGMIELFRAVALKDGITSEHEREQVAEFLNIHRSAKWDDAYIENLLKKFGEPSDETPNIKNASYVVKNRSPEMLRRQFLTALYRVAHKDGITGPERAAVDDIGEWLGLPYAVIRQISLSSRRDKS